MKPSKRTFRNIILPLALLVTLMTLLIGCIYIPTFDHKLLTGTKTDFRTWAVQHKDTRPSQLAIITRSEIESTFGKPAFVSHDGRNIAYVMGTENGIQIWPLCFGGGFTDGKTNVLKLCFDDKAQLKRIVSLEAPRSPPLYMFGSNMWSNEDADPIICAKELLEDENHHCPSDEVLEIIDRSSPSLQP